MILIAPDKFKGSLTAEEAAAAVARGLAAAGCREEIIIRPMADGGEGMPRFIDGYPVVAVSDHVGLSNQELMSLPLIERSSYPLGKFLNESYGSTATGSSDTADRSTYYRIWIGIGGTMVSDGGAGMLQALGARFYDSEGNLIQRHVTPEILTDISRVDVSAVDVGFWRGRLYALSDVAATLTGPGLCALDFARQKGASEKDMDVIRRGLERFAALTSGGRRSPIDGAGGGIGFAVSSVIGARYGSGAEVILRHSDIPWDSVSTVITGEGRIDGQTAGGKVVETVLKAAEERNIKAIAVGGYVEPELRSANIISTIDDPSDYSPALAEERLASTVAEVWKSICER